MTDQEKITASAELIKSHFVLENIPELDGIDSFEDFEVRMSTIIEYYLNNDMNGLLNAFYRMDISEGKFKEILIQNDPENIALDLARLVISREMEKVITREKYKGY